MMVESSVVLMAAATADHWDVELVVRKECDWVVLTAVLMVSSMDESKAKKMGAKLVTLAVDWMVRRMVVA